MPTLATLIKVAQTRLDEQRHVVARMAERVDSLEKALAANHAQQVREGQAAAQDPGGALTYGAFLRRAIDEAQALEEQRRKALEAFDLAHAKLTELFEEQKRYEVAERNRLGLERRKQDRRESATLDELGQTTFLRARDEQS